MTHSYKNTVILSVMTSSGNDMGGNTADPMSILNNGNMHPPGSMPGVDPKSSFQGSTIAPMMYPTSKFLLSKLIFTKLIPSSNEQQTANVHQTPAFYLKR